MTRRLSLFLSVLVFIFAAAAVLIRVVAAPSAGKSAAERLGMAHPTVVAHRGASYLAPEATAPAYILARELGADYLEMDIQRTSDGVLIAYHDDTFERTTDVAARFPARAGNPVADFSLAEVKSLDAGSWFNARFPDRARPSYGGLKYSPSRRSSPSRPRHESRSGCISRARTRNRIRASSTKS